MTEDPVKEAISLIKSGKKSEAAAILEPYIRANPHDIQAWLWETETRESVPWKLKILEMCLQRNPDDPQVKRALALLKSREEEQLAKETPTNIPPKDVSSEPPPASPQIIAENEPTQEVPPKLVPCPYCTEMVQANTTVCPYCKRDFKTGSVNTPSDFPAAQPLIIQNLPKNNKRAGCSITGVILAIILFLIFYNVFGFFTVQPIGAIPDGVTMLIVRAGTQLKFFDSADAMCERIQGGVSLLCRLGALGALADQKEIIILRLPYIEAFYLASTGGVTYEN